MEWLKEHIQAAFMKYWIPGRDVTIDECMIGFTGRSNAILKIPSKPISEGYKGWVLAQSGYVLAWLWHQKTKGPIGIPRVPKALGSNKTAAVVPFLLNLLPKRPGLRYVVWLDNLFSSTKLFNYLRDLDYGAVGTCRTDSGICKDFVNKKAQDKKVDKIPWGTLEQAPTADSHIMQTAWKDNALVLLMSTIHEASDTKNHVIRNRKRPALTSTSAKTARKPFGNEVRKDLPIPKLIDDYNRRMNGVDIADQLREHESGHRRVCTGGWHALFYFIFNTVLVNSYLLSSVETQAEFRTLLYLQLLGKGASTRKRKWSVPQPDSGLCIAPDKPETREDQGSEAPLHKRVHRSKTGDCCGCHYAGLTRAPKKRRILGEIDPNSGANFRARRSIYGCLACNVPLCKEGPCFDLFHERSVENHQ
jgi:hypothetical protein